MKPHVLKSYLVNHLSQGAKPESMEKPNLKTTVKAKVLDIKSAFVPSSYHGV